MDVPIVTINACLMINGANEPTAEYFYLSGSSNRRPLHPMTDERCCTYKVTGKDDG